ncbi:MAG: 50S ribosomal protein L33 [Phycisphaerae bacterium SM23_33]|jgi:large subunit ribosomal protein L33|nr:MAG: 50S ribosomal protein L33 [Phycisphaerae bacterium SM23_33]
MAKSKAREYVWLQCSTCDALNYRTQVRAAGGTRKLSLKKYCPTERKHTEHKIKRK